MIKYCLTEQNNDLLNMWNPSRRGSADTVVSTISDVSVQSIQSSVSSDCLVTRRLLDLMHETDYDLVQENGQRRLTAPELTEDKRDRIKGAEVFLGRLPRDCYEDELMPILERPGRLLELRLMLDFSGTTRGYAFALYTDPKTAQRACSVCNCNFLIYMYKIKFIKSFLVIC